MYIKRTAQCMWRKYFKPKMHNIWRFVMYHVCFVKPMHNRLIVICVYLSDFDLWINRISAVGTKWNQSLDSVLYRTHGDTKTHCREILWKFSSVLENVIPSVHWIRFIYYYCDQWIVDDDFKNLKMSQTGQSEWNV